ncbi:hypothetical protein [Salinactinospora qingdaonensis]
MGHEHRTSSDRGHAVGAGALPCRGKAQRHRLSLGVRQRLWAMLAAALL